MLGISCKTDIIKPKSPDVDPGFFPRGGVLQLWRPKAADIAKWSHTIERRDHAPPGEVSHTISSVANVNS